MKVKQHKLHPFINDMSHFGESAYYFLSNERIVVHFFYGIP